MFLLNSRTSLFVATASSSGSKSLHRKRHPLFRSYGVNLPSSLTLVSLAHLRLLASPTCVGFGTVTLSSTFRSFSRQCSHSEFSRVASEYLTTLGLAHHGFAYGASYGLRPTCSAVGSPDFLRPSITPTRWYRNINLSSIDYAFRPTCSAVGSPDFLRPSITPTRWYRNINLSSIDYAFRPRLRFRLTPGGRTFPGKP